MSSQVFSALGYLLLLLTEISIIHSSSSCVRNLIQTGITPQEKLLILDVHNKMRQMVAMGMIQNQPPAANMMKMVWSDALAQKAQQWAMSCQQEIHDPGRHIGEFFVGQNIATKWTTKHPSTFEDMAAHWYLDAIAKWFQEYTAYNYYSNGGHRTGHYTQLVWAETTTVGCGYAFYLDGNRRYTKKYVCNYGPSGNIIGEQPYEKGYPSCYNHGLTNSRLYPGLCEKEPSANPYDKYKSSYPFSLNNNLNGYVFDVFHF